MKDVLSTHGDVVSVIFLPLQNFTNKINKTIICTVKLINAIIYNKNGVSS